MKVSVPAQYAALSALLEDMHALSLEGRRRDSCPDMQMAVAGLLADGAASLGEALTKINLKLQAAKETERL